MKSEVGEKNIFGTRRRKVLLIILLILATLEVLFFIFITTEEIKSRFIKRKKESISTFYDLDLW